MILKYDQIHELYALRGSMPPSIHYRHQSFSLPTKGWVLKVFAPSFRTNLVVMGLVDYQDEKWNCVCFSELCRGFACAMHARTPGHDGTALACHLFDYMTPKGPHEIVSFVCGPNPEDILDFEPQLAQEVRLTDQELFSCFEIYI